MALAYVYPTSVVTGGTNVASGAVTDIDSGINNGTPDDGTRLVTTANAFVTGTVIDFALGDLGAEVPEDGINGITVYVRGDVVANKDFDDTNDYVFSFSGTGAPTGSGTLQYQNTVDGGTTFSAIQRSKFYDLSLPTKTQFNALNLRITQTWSQSMGADGSALNISEIEVEVDYTPAPVAPVLTLPTEANIGQTTVTVGCTTDTAAGTLYYYISTSATAPTAANLKAGTGAVKFGNVTTPGVGTETFNVTGLNNNTTYYTYFIHNDTNDSNLLESGSWSTLPPATDSQTFTISLDKNLSNVKTTLATLNYNAQLNKLLTNSKDTVGDLSLLSILNYNFSVSLSDAISLIVQLAQQESNTKDANVSLNLQGTLDFLMANILTGTSSITLGTLLNQILDNNKNTSESASFGITLDTTQDATISIAGAVAFGITTAFAIDNFAALLAQMNVDIVLSEAEQVSKLLSDAVSFSFTATFERSPTEVGVFDDPVFTGDNYIFVDLSNILAQEGGVKTGSVTFTTSLGQTQTVGLIGAAAQTFLVAVAQNQVNTKDTTATNTFSALLDKQLAFGRSLSFNADLNLSVLEQGQADLLRSILYSLNMVQDQTNTKDTSDTLSVTAQLDYNVVNQLAANANISFDITLDFLRALQSDLVAAISYITQLNFAFVSGANETVNFNVSMLQTQQVRGILAASLNLISQLSQVEEKQMVTSKTLSLLVQLQQQQAYNQQIFETVNFILSMTQVNTNTITVDRAMNLIVSMSDNYNNQLSKSETILLLIQLLDSYTNTKTVPGALTLNVSLDQTQTNLLTKLLNVAFSVILTKIPQGQADFNALVSFATVLSHLFIGDSTGAIQGLITFAVQVAQDNVGLANYFRNIPYNLLMSESGIGSKVLLDSVEIIAQLSETETFNLTRYGSASFQTFFNKVFTSRTDFRPTLDFDLTMLEASASTKNTLATMLLGMEAQLIEDHTKAVPALVNYGIQQNLQTEIHLVADGRVTLSAELADSATVQMLGQAGITFGHLVGLSALSSADIAKSIAFGTIHDFSADGFVIQFTIVTPDGRKLKIYFEDRMTIVDEDDRVIKIYKSPRSEPTNN